MLTTYIDDSGTAPEHKVAVACGIVIPADRIKRFECAWRQLLNKEKIPDFHASPCLAKNAHSAFASWDEATVRRVFKEVRKLTIRFSVIGFCIGVHKKDYDEVVLPEMRAAVGNSYFTWALSSLVGLIWDYAEWKNMPMHYVLARDTNKEQRREILDSVNFVENSSPGFAGQWQFAQSADVPGLQAADLWAWTCYQQFRRARFNEPISPIAQETYLGYKSARGGEWAIIQSLSREGIEAWVRKNRDNPRTQEIIKFKEQQKEARKPKRKNPKSTV